MILLIFIGGKIKKVPKLKKCNMSAKDQFIDMAQMGVLHFQKRLYISCSIIRCQVTIFMFDASRMVRFTLDSKVEE